MRYDSSVDCYLFGRDGPVDYRESKSIVVNDVYETYQTPNIWRKRYGGKERALKRFKTHHDRKHTDRLKNGDQITENRPIWI